MKPASSSRFRLGVAAAVVVSANSAAAQFEEVRATIHRELVATSTPSVAVAVARDGKIIWEEGFGWADREKRIPATEHTMYSLASISKPITATGLMVLVERGEIDLDRPLNDYLGDAKIDGRAFDASQATVRLVANHTAGLPLHYQFFYEDEPYRRPAMDETIRRYANLVTPPGERYQYSNLGYGLLDYVIERVSGQGYADFMRREVFLPLGLTRMSVHIGPGLGDYAATRYAPDGTPIPFYDFDHPGGSAVFASAHDLVCFGMFHLKNHLPDQRAILCDETIDEMHRATALDKDGSENGYGIGWRVETSESGLRTVSHGGGMGGVSTTLRLLPEENAALVVLCNSGNSRLTGQIAEQIMAVLAPDKIESRASERSERRSSAEPEGPEFSPMPEVCGVWKGDVFTYEGPLPVTFAIRESGEVYIQLDGRPWTVLDEATFTDGVLQGVFVGDVRTEDVNRRSYNLRLEVKKRGDVLNGSLIARSLPANRTGNALTHWIEVKRE